MDDLGCETTTSSLLKNKNQEIRCTLDLQFLVFSFTAEVALILNKII